MSYRAPEKHDMYHHIYDLATQSILYVDNGTISYISIPCFYIWPQYHDRLMHDHVGWPNPDNPDKSCQLMPRYDRILVTKEINLIEEGYTSVEVSIEDAPDGLVIEGEVKPTSVELSINAMCPSAEKEDIDVNFAVYVVGESDAYGTLTSPIDLRDVVIKGVLHIVAGSIG